MNFKTFNLGKVEGTKWVKSKNQPDVLEGDFFLDTDGQVYIYENSQWEAYTIIKGKTGEIIGTVATVENSSGVPVVEVKNIGTTENAILKFNFKNMKGEKGDKGDPFIIKKTYNSITEMNNNYATDGLAIGDMVIIASNVEDEDNGKIYFKGEEAYVYVTDLSGTQGIQGPSGIQQFHMDDMGNLIMETIDDVPQDYSIDENGNLILSRESENFTRNLGNVKGPKGDTGPQGEIGPQGETGDQGVGISNIEQTITSTDDNGTNEITITLEDSREFKFNVKNGSQGEPGTAGADGKTMYKHRIKLGYQSDDDGYRDFYCEITSSKSESYTVQELWDMWQFPQYLDNLHRIYPINGYMEDTWDNWTMIVTGLKRSTSVGNWTAYGTFISGNSGSAIENVSSDEFYDSVKEA